MDWLEELTEKMSNALSEGKIKEPIIFNSGLSVSGLQHVGRLRGELLIGSTVSKTLKEKGVEVKQFLTLYTQDEWKGKPPQLKQFSSQNEALKYKGWPLSNVPDPKDCHESWVDHFWAPFGKNLGEFVNNVETVTTTQLYKEKMKPYVKKALRKKDEIVKILNKYREETLPSDWPLYHPICEKCGKIGDKRKVDVFLDDYEVEYTCDCGYSGRNSMEKGKLAWRIEWAAIWSALNVDFEPYGKDHAAPGGSRDTANEISKKIYNKGPPIGTAYEWVAYKENGKERVMGSSDFKGFTPETWLELAEAEILNYIYLLRNPMKQITLDLAMVPHYARRFRQGEKIFFNKEGGEKRLKEAYRYSFATKPPQEFPFRIPYSHAALFVQTVSPTIELSEIIGRLRSQGILERNLSGQEKELLRTRLKRARNWVNNWAPERYRISLLDAADLSNFAQEILSLIGEEKQIIEELIHDLKEIKWTSSEIKEKMREIISPLPSNTTRKVFQALYLTFLGKKRGPRIARYFSLLDRELVIKRLTKLQSLIEK